jgi:hypothetical protein
MAGANFKKKLLFVPNADTNPKVEHEISEPALFRYLLNEETIQEFKELQAEIPAMLNTLSGIDKLSRITEIEIHQSSMSSVTDESKAFHVFIVFNTTSGKDEDFWWWSLEKNMEYIVLQRSRNKNDVKDKLYGKERKKAKSIDENLAGKGTIKDLFSILWAYQVISERYSIFTSNCQSLVTLVSNKITEIGYEFKGFPESIPLLSLIYDPHFSARFFQKRNAKMLDFINILSNSFKRDTHILYIVVISKNIFLFDKVMKSGHYNIDDPIIPDGSTPLHLAIVSSTLEMVRHLLQKWKADPTIRDRRGRTALQTAIFWASNNMEIIDLLLQHEKVDINERDELFGRTALHWAVRECNSIAVGHLIDKAANPNIYDNDGLSALHLAAYHEKGTEIMDLILKAKKSKQNDEGIDDVDDEFGTTALHMAVVASNEIIVEYLIEKGADINYRHKSGCTPLHLAAFVQDKPIIELLKNIMKEDVDKFKMDAASLLGHITANENRLINKNIVRVGEKDIFHREECDQLAEKSVFGKMKDPFLSSIFFPSTFTAAGDARLKYLKADWDN